MEGMSMMFSPYGDGPLPPTAMAELEKKLKSNKRTGNFLKMLELEKKKQKVEELQSAPVTAPPSPPPLPAKSQDTASLQDRRAESAAQQQSNQMQSAARRSVILPSLSLSIPQPPDGQRGRRPQEPRSENGKGSERAGEKETESSAESLHKHVKFLALDEGEMSDQSSICQSPSWEGYGQRKKEKKKEAERKKKEREQAEKEARATKKRYGARLSKSPPPPLPDRSLVVPGLTNADRSMSDPLLISLHLLPNRQSEQLPADVGRTASADNLQQLRHHQPDMAEVLSDFQLNGQQFLGGVKVEKEKEAPLQGQYSFPYSQYSTRADVDDPQQSQHSTSPDSAMPGAYSSTKQDGRHAFPPSASRTPMLRHVPASGHNRSNSLLQGATKIFKGRDGKPQGDGDSDRGRHRDGYAQHYREQSTERSLAEIAYDQLINNGSFHSSSTRSSSRHTQNTRRSSFSQEAKSVAMKLAGIKTSPAAREDSFRSNRASLHRDYFSYVDSRLEAPVAHGSATSSSRVQDDGRAMPVDEPALSRGESRDAYLSQDRPATAHSSGSSSNPSVAGSTSSDHHKKTRGPREATKPTQHAPTDSLPLRNTSASGANGQGPLAGPVLGKAVASLRSDFMKTSTASIPRPDSATVPLESCDPITRPAIQPISNPPKPVEVDTNVGRVSEGSSSSSAYEDGSPVSSPVTTPATSRPQSSRGVPFTVGEIVKGMSEPSETHDDESTLRQSSDKSSNNSGQTSTSSTPRLLKSDAMDGADETDRFQRGGMVPPAEADCDAQSFTTPFSNLDNIDNINETFATTSTSSRPPREAPSTRTQTEESQFLNLAETLQNSTLGQTLVEPQTHHDASDKPSFDPPISIPPRSKRRGTGSSRSPTSPIPSAGGEEQAMDPEHDESNQEVMKMCLDSAKRAVDMRMTNQSEMEPLYDEDLGAMKREKAKRRQRQVISRSPDELLEHEGDRGLPSENFASLDLNSTTFIVPEVPRSPYQSSFPGSYRAPSSASRSSSRAGASPPSPGSARFPEAASPPPPLSPGFGGPSRMVSAPSIPWRPPSAASTRSSATNSSLHGPPGTRTATSMAPVSILKHPARATSDASQPASSAGSRASVLSALPKHMQLQAGVSTRPPGMSPEARMAPIAKMFVECCSCKFYHDMPSKLYECMAKPDAVVEDRLLGISGAITTMVKCPWCQHNMNTSCCAGYAAVVYLKEKLH